MDRIKELFCRKYGVAPDVVTKLCGDGSNRAYYRLSHGDLSVIGVMGTAVEENRTFIAVAKAFAESGLDAPEILAVSDDALCYLQNDR